MRTKVNPEDVESILKVMVGSMVAMILMESMMVHGPGF
jgi:hypothetical protein